MTLIQTTTVRTRQVIEAEVTTHTEYPGILRMLRREWKDAPVGACNTAGHENIPAVEAKRVVGGWMHCCQPCKDRQDAHLARYRREDNKRRAESAMRGARAQTQHRQ